MLDDIGECNTEHSIDTASMTCDVARNEVRVTGAFFEFVTLLEGRIRRRRKRYLECLRFLKDVNSKVEDTRVNVHDVPVPLQSFTHQGLIGRPALYLDTANSTLYQRTGHQAQEK